MGQISLTDSVSVVPLVGDAYLSKLSRLNISSVFDLLKHYPAKYIDRREVSSISTLILDEVATIEATVYKFSQFRSKSGKQIQQALVGDETGKLTLYWFNQSYLSRVIKEGQRYAFSGKAKLFSGRITLNVQDLSPIAEDGSIGPQAQIHVGRLVPVYPETAGVSSKWLRSRIAWCLKNTIFEESLPQQICSTYNLTGLDKALNSIHFPESDTDLHIAKNRLAFEELFFLQLTGAWRRRNWQQSQTSTQLAWPKEQLDQFVDGLPFDLTKAQAQATAEILKDLVRTQPMNRLLEGDVGSGKTVVAAIGLMATSLAGYRGVIMAPTEILAQQHFQELNRLFHKTDIKIGLATSSKKLLLDSQIVVGTHALLYQQHAFDQVGLVVIDEQHRFGVEQRAKLESLASHPHRLTMSATPIPRTIALTLYGDLDVSIIDELPKDRQKVKTWVVPEAKRQASHQWIRQQISSGGQMFVVCPLIDESESIALKHIRSAAQEHQHLSQIFPEFTIDLLHGRLKANEKSSIIERFKANKSQVLVATQVIEVGIDVPNATIIMIEAADRFGLAQLHQLRGRVGRGSKPGYCLLFSSSDQSSARLESMTKYHSGFKLAEIDLKLRGPGEVFGVSQHGFGGIKLARLSDKKLMTQTRQAAEEYLSQDPKLERINWQLLSRQAILENRITDN